MRQGDSYREAVREGTEEQGSLLGEGQRTEGWQGGLPGEACCTAVFECFISFF